MTGMTKLIDLMKVDDQVMWDSLEKHKPHTEIQVGSGSVCRDPGNEMPSIDEAAHAALIIAGCTATWHGTFWRVTHKNGKFTHVSRNASFEEWHTCLSRIGDQQFGG